MKNIKRVQRYAAMIMCYIYVLSLMIAAYAIKQRNNRNKMIQREIVSTSTRRRRQQEYLHRVVYESDIKCIDKLRMDRRCFHNLCELLTTTGGLRGTVNVGVQEMTAMFLNIIAHHAYDEYVKAHKEAAGLYGKSFPFFNDLVQVFAKDRAQGTAGGDIGDDAEQYQHEDINLNDDRAFFEMATDDFVMSTEEPIPTQSPMVSDAGISKTRRKRKMVTTDQSFYKLNDNLNNLAEMVGPGFQALADSANREDAREAARIEAEKVARAKRDEKITLLGEIIFEIDGLTDDEAMFILQKLPNNDTQMKIFFNLPDNRKLRFCRVFLARSSFSPHG